jgi:hypothetical protein
VLTKAERQTAKERSSGISSALKHEAIVDADLYPRIREYKWRLSPNRYTSYVKTNDTEPSMLLHNVLMQPAPGMIVDHKNHNGLDNRRRNLRVCTYQQNARNTRPSASVNKTSVWKGVGRHKPSQQWQARIWIDRKPTFLGLFDTEADAATAYNFAADQWFGEFAYYNLAEQTCPFVLECTHIHKFSWEF